MTILEKYTKEELEFLLNESISFRQFLKKIGSSTNGSSAYNSIKKQLDKLNIIIPIYNCKNNFHDKKRLEDDEVFIENSTYSRGHLKERIIKNNLIEYKCNKCRNKGKWINRELVLQLDHINGINNDNRLENLQFLCPNCHSQTETFAGKSLNKIKKIEKKKYKKNIKIKEIKIKKCLCGEEISLDANNCKKCNNKNQRRVERPSYEILIKEIEELGYNGTGRKYEVSDTAIRKWKKQYEKLI
jgi:Zn finger protein HypA/HybF involved in hydrogenase expression